LGDRRSTGLETCWDVIVRDKRRIFTIFLQQKIRDLAQPQFEPVWAQLTDLTQSNATDLALNIQTFLTGRPKVPDRTLSLDDLFGFD
jgi:hypothetical protein